MKNKTKLQISALLALVLMISVAFTQESSEKDIIIVKAAQYGQYARGAQSHIKVYKGEKMAERTVLAQYSFQSEDSNMLKILDVLKRYQKEGYDLTSHQQFIGEGGVVDTFILTK